MAWPNVGLSAASVQELLLAPYRTGRLDPGLGTTFASLCLELIRLFGSAADADLRDMDNRAWLPHVLAGAPLRVEPPTTPVGAWADHALVLELSGPIVVGLLHVLLRTGGDKPKAYVDLCPCKVFPLAYKFNGVMELLLMLPHVGITHARCGEPTPNGPCPALRLSNSCRWLLGHCAPFPPRTPAELVLLDELVEEQWLLELHGACYQVHNGRSVANPNPLWAVLLDECATRISRRPMRAAALTAQRLSRRFEYLAFRLPGGSLNELCTGSGCTLLTAAMCTPDFGREAVAALLHRTPDLNVHLRGRYHPGNGVVQDVTAVEFLEKTFHGQVFARLHPELANDLCQRAKTFPATYPFDASGCAWAELVPHRLPPELGNVVLGYAGLPLPPRNPQPSVAEL